MQDTLNTTQETATVSSGGQAQITQVTLLEKKKFPPHGWLYREPELGWKNPDPLNGGGLPYAVGLLQIARAQNPASGLDPSYAACEKAIMDFTCHRLNYDPRWCGLPPAEAQKQSSAHPVNGRRCASCGRR